LGLTFPNLPYFFDGDLKITQSGAIIHYVARKAGMMPQDNRVLAELEMIENEVIDLRNAWVDCVYSDPNTFEEKKKDHYKGLPSILEKFNGILAARKWLIGEQITYVDFMFYETMSAHSAMWPDLLNEYPKIKTFVHQFESLPQIERYIKSSRYINRPYNNPSACFK